MARSERRGQRSHGHGAGHHERDEAPTLDADQERQVAELLAGMPALAESLRAAAPEGHDALTARLVAVSDAPEPVALAFALRLGDVRGDAARDAADVAQAMGELEARRDVAREARRARLRLRSTGAPATLPIPATTPAAGPSGATRQVDTHATPLIAPSLATVPAPRSLRLALAFASRTRERGELALVLGWQEGSDPNFVRGHVFELGFWQEGVRDFSLVEPMSRGRFERDVLAPLREDDVELVPVTWAQARRLVLEALDVNEWRGTQPHSDFQRHRALIAPRLLDVPDDADARAEVEAEEARAATEGDRFLISGELESDEVALNWLGSWSFGDFALAYDLLANDHATRQKEGRAAYIALRRQWAKEAEPSGLRVALVREQERRASALWVPGAAGVIGAGERKDVEVFWSLVLREVEMGGQLDELPLATITSKETGRHWYWTGYTLARDRASGLWLITRSRDEGATSQALTVEELQKRVAEAHETVQRITASPPPDPRSEEAARALETITGALTAGLHYRDAVTVRLPLDEANYRDAIVDARTLGNHERAAAVIERMGSRFGNETRNRFELGVEQYLVAEQYAQQGAVEAETAWLERAVGTLTAVVTAEPTAEHLQGLGELLARQGHYHQAEARLREGIAADPQRAMLYSDLSDALMGRITGENLDAPTEPSADERRAIAREALGALREAAKLDNTIAGLYARMGAIYDLLGQPEDALIALEEGVRHDPGDGAAHYALGSLLLAREKGAEALPHLETAVQLNPLAVPQRLNLAACYGALERYADAQHELDLVDRLQPGLPQTAELRSIIARQRNKR